MLLTVAAYLFRNAQAFRKLTAALVLNHHGSYLGLFGKEVESVLPWEVFCMCFNEHLIIMKTLAGRAKRFREAGNGRYSCKRCEFGGCDYGCGWTSTCAYAYISKLEVENLWPARFSNTSISKALERAEMMPDPVPSERTTACNMAHFHSVPQYRISRSVRLERLNKSIGLCLECVREGATLSNVSIHLIVLRTN